MITMDLMVFDFDGTLVDTGEDIVRAVNFTLRSLGLPERPYGEAIGFIGDGVQRLLERSLGEGKKKLYAEARNIFLAYYGDHLLDATRLYTGVDDVLRHFEGKRKWIVTNKLYEFTIRIAGALQIHGYFDGIIGRDSTPYVKPDARILEGLMKQHGVSGERTVMIGDGVHDMGMARNAGAWGCAFLNGLGDRKGLLRQRPDFTCENILELKTLFC